MMKKILLLSLFAITASLSAGVIHFRSGQIIAAEISASSPKINQLDEKFAFPTLPKDRLYAVVSVKLDDARKISIFDYSLESFGATYPCIAINSSGSFESSELTFSTPGKCIQLLFIIENQSMNKTESLKLKCNLPPTDGTYDLLIPFSYLGHRPFSSPGTIPANGLFESSAK